MKSVIKVLKLLTGEEIITRLSEGENGDLHLEKPMVIQVISESQGKLNVGLVRWSMGGKTESCTLNDKHIMIMLDPQAGIETTYLSAITGISL
tara:strand:- start:98 stop:376 length:279 start_codon:yes stop_codon:yes gene_type:complete